MNRILFFSWKYLFFRIEWGVPEGIFLVHFLRGHLFGHDVDFGVRGRLLGYLHGIFFDVELQWVQGFWVLVTIVADLLEIFVDVHLGSVLDQKVS